MNVFTMRKRQAIRGMEGRAGAINSARSIEQITACYAREICSKCMANLKQEPMVSHCISTIYFLTFSNTLLYVYCVGATSAQK